MKRLLVAVFLLLFQGAAQQANPSTPATESSVQKRNAQQGHSNADKKDADTSTTTIRSLDKTQPNPCHCPNDSYNAGKDTAYRAYLWFTIIGVIGAWCGIVVLYLQTRATQEAAIAAKQQADNITNSERAWVIVRIEDHEPNSTLYAVVLTNYGSTPARIVEVRGDLRQFDKGVNLPDGPSYETDILPAKKLLAPKEEWSILTFPPHEVFKYVAGGTERLDIEQFFIGYVAYRHIFDSKDSPHHYTRFCFHLRANWTWQAFGSSAYHEYS